MTLKTITASIALLGLAVGTAQAGSPAAPQADQAQATTTPSRQQTQQERRVVRDSVTGKLRAPSDEELAAMSAQPAAAAARAAQPAPAPMVVRQHANGMRSAVLGDEYLSTLMAERKADGKLVIRHANPAHEHGAAAKPNTTTKTNE